MEFWEDYEILRVETPENLDLHLPLAGFGPRFLAYGVDALIFTTLQVVLGASLFFAVMALGIGSAISGFGEWLVVALFIASGLVILFMPFFYFSIFESIWAGQSPGKRVAGIRVIRRGGFPVGRREILWRNVMRIIDMLPSSGIIGLISFFATRHQQRLGDLVADTVVIREFTRQQPYAWLGAAGSSVAAPAAGVLTPALAYVIGNYLQRATQFTDESRADLTRRCIEALGYEAVHLDVSQREQYLLSVLQQSWAVSQ